GQPPSNIGDTHFRAVWLNKDYDLGLIMFYYNLYGLGFNNPDTTQPGQLRSPYDAGIVNANYLALTPHYKIDKWTFKSAFVIAWAEQTAGSNQLFYNYQYRDFSKGTAITGQNPFLGWEGDLGVSFKWDENFLLGWDFGFFFPGAYYAFTNDPS